MSTIITVFIGMIGAGLASIIGAPAPFLTGSATLVTLSALINIKCTISIPVRNISFAIIGISTAEGLSSSVFESSLNWPVSLIGMCFSITLLVILGRLIFQYYFKLDRNTSILASSPGHLSYVLSLSEDISGNTVIISVIQSIRVLTLTLAVPGTIALFTDYNMQSPISSAQVLSHSHLAIIIAFSMLVGLALLRFKIPAAFLLGGMVCSTIGHGFDLTPGIVPNALAVSAFIVLGSLIGSRFTGVSFSTFKSCIFKGTLFTSLSLLISIFVAFIISLLTEFRLIEILIAIAPGGLETMVVMGRLVGADPAFVALHHLVRLFFLLILLSFMMRKEK
jgi:membrane AbrB-like protein